MIKVGIIGSGFGLYGLAPAFQQVHNCQVIGICGKRSERLESYCAEWGIELITENYKKLIDSAKPDILAIATTPDRQFEIAKYALENGIHVFAEKPLCVNLEEASELLRLAQSKNLKHCIDFIFVQHPAFLEAKKLIDEKKLELLEINVTWHFQSYDLKNGVKGWKTDATKGGGAIAFYLSHVLHYLEWSGGSMDHVLLTKSVTSPKSLNKAETLIQSEGSFTCGAKWKIDFDCDNPNSNSHVIELKFKNESFILKSENSPINFVLSRKQLKSWQIIDVNPLTADDTYDQRIPYILQLAQVFVSSITKNTGEYPTFHEGLRVQVLINQLKAHQDELLS